MVWSIWCQDRLKLLLFPCLPTACFFGGRPLQQSCCKLLEEMPQLHKKWNLQTDTTPETDPWVCRGEIRNESWFQGRDLEAGFPQAWIIAKHLVAVHTWMFRGDFCSGRNSLYFVCQETIKLLPNVIIFPLGKMCLHQGSARIALCPENYQSVLLPFYSALSSLIGIFVSEVTDKFIVFSS